MRGDINVSLECFVILDTAGCGNYLLNESFGMRKEFKLSISDVFILLRQLLTEDLYFLIFLYPTLHTVLYTDSVS